MLRRNAAASLIAVVVMFGPLAACGDDSDGATQADDAAATSSTAPATTSTTEEDGCTTEEMPLEIVLVNDDGIVNPAIDVMLEMLQSNDDLHLDITLVAPADERSGTSDTTTPGGASYEEATTPGGATGYSVNGYPADAVLVALGDLGLEPHLVLSGINPGNNFGAFAPYSGTVGAARTAVRNGTPALAVSGGLQVDQAQYEVGADLALDWIIEHCEALMASEHQLDTVTSINIPACAPEDMGPLLSMPRALEMPVLPEGESIWASTCDLADEAPANDVAAVRSGYPTITQVEVEFPS